MTLGFILGPWFLNIPTGQSTIPGVYFWRVPFAHYLFSHQIGDWARRGAIIFKESFFGRSGLKSASPSIFEQGFSSLKYSLKLPSFPESVSTCNFFTSKNSKNWNTKN